MMRNGKGVGQKIDIRSFSPQLKALIVQIAILYLDSYSDIHFRWRPITQERP